MKEFNDLNEIAENFGVKYVDVLKNHEEQGWRGKFFVDNKEIKIETINNKDNKELKYVYVDEKDNKSCKDYLMKYEVPNMHWKVYVDDLEGWQNCDVLNIDNNGLDIISATVKTDYGTTLNRLVEYALDVEDIKTNRNIFMIENCEEKQYEENDFYSTKGKILLASDYRGGYFLNPETENVENIVYKDSGYGNCVMGSLDYMKKLIKSNELKGIKDEYEYTAPGKLLLDIKDKKKDLDEIIKEASCKNTKEKVSSSKDKVKNKGKDR